MTIADRLTELNRWYEDLPDDRRIFVYPGVLLVAALVNARWFGTPFGWLFFATLAALFVIRRSHVSGYLKTEALAGGPVAAAAHRAEPAAAPRAFVAQPAPVQPVVKPAPAPVATQAAARPTPQPAPPPPVAAQPVAKPAPQPPVQQAAATPTVDGPAPHSAPAAAASSPKKNVPPPPRKNDGRSGRRKPGDKHP
jgi:outer membrane biosynthesis protein TonB